MRFNHTVFEEFYPEQLSGLIPGADMQHRIIGRGNTHVQYRSCRFGACEIYTGRVGFPVWINGSFPERRYFFGMRGGYTSQLTINELLTPVTGLAVWPPGCEVHYLSGGEEQWIAYSVPEAALRQQYFAIYKRDIDLPARDLQFLDLPKPICRMVLAKIEDLLELTSLLANTKGKAGVEAYMEKSFIRFVVIALGSAARLPQNHWLSPSERIALRALYKFTAHWMKEREGPFKVSRIRDVSPRTLERAMKRAYGIPPDRFLKLIRLNGAFRDLAQSPSTPVTEVCWKWRFRHLSRFSAEYRELFGETPSETARRLSSDRESSEGDTAPAYTG